MVRQGAHRLEQKAARWRRWEGERAVEERCCGFQYRAEGAYPPVRAAGRNSRYAGMMLGNLGGSGSEMSAVALYSYDRLMTAELPEVSEVFRQVSLVERDHMDIFGELARQLGADPRLWCRQGGRPTWWTPGYLNYASSLEAMLRVALREERMAVRRYREQMESIHDENIVTIWSVSYGTRRSTSKFLKASVRPTARQKEGESREPEGAFFRQNKKGRRPCHRRRSIL